MSARTVAFRMQLHPGQEAEYERRHDAIWPELETALRRAGVLDFRIFLDPQTLALFAVMTRRDDHGLETLAQSEVMRRWWAMMADIMETNPDKSPVEVPLTQVFALSPG